MAQHLRLVGIALMVAGVVVLLPKAGVDEATFPITAVIVISVLLILGRVAPDRACKRSRSVSSVFFQAPSRHVSPRRLLLAAALAAGAAALAGCGGSNAKAYDIGPVFPLDPNKCARYGGDQKGSGPTASCMVTKAECEKAASDWKQAMQSSGVNDAIEFTCR